LFHGSLFDIMAHLLDISAGFVGEIIGGTFLPCQAREPFALLRRVGNEVARDKAFGRVLRIPIERWAVNQPVASW
jgi:hypothetical protein